MDNKSQINTSVEDMGAARVFLHVKHGTTLSDEFLQYVIAGLGVIAQQIKDEEAKLENAPVVPVDCIYLHVKFGETTTVSHVGFDFPPKKKLSLGLHLLREVGELASVAKSSALTKLTYDLAVNERGDHA